MIDPRLTDFIGADVLGQSFPCRHCDEIVDGQSEPATEDGEAHLACAIASGELDAHVCRACRAYAPTETDSHGHCEGCAARVAEIAARTLAIETAARTLGFTAYRVLRGVITMSRVDQPYRSTHGEMQWLRQLAKLGFLRCLGARTVGGKAFAYDYVPTDDGRAVAAARDAIARRAA